MMKTQFSGGKAIEQVSQCIHPGLQILFSSNLSWSLSLGIWSYDFITLRANTKCINCKWGAIKILKANGLMHEFLTQLILYKVLAVNIGPPGDYQVMLYTQCKISATLLFDACSVTVCLPILEGSSTVS